MAAELAPVFVLMATSLLLKLSNATWATAATSTGVDGPDVAVILGKTRLD